MFYSGKINQAEHSKCWKWACDVHVARADQDEWNDDQGEHRRIRKFIGKIGEIGATKAGYPGEPDWGVWDQPLTTPDLWLIYYVKTCSYEEAKKYGVSWLVDDALGFYPEGKVLVLALADLAGGVIVLGHIPAEQLLGHYGNPRNPKHRGRKRAIWLKDAIDPANGRVVPGIIKLIQPCPIRS
jgi:hypothetical protein